MSAYPARAYDRYALVGFALGALSILALLVAYSFGIQHWPPGLEGPGAIVCVCAFPISLAGSLCSFVGCFFAARRGLAVAGLVLSLAALLVIVGVGILAWIALSQEYQYGSVSWRSSS